MKDPLRVTTVTQVGKRLRRWIARNEWAVSLLGLQRADSKPTDPGLVLVEVDGLSQSQLSQAVADGKLPFTRSLLKREQYTQHDLYSGLPSLSASAQAELFYGQRAVLPAATFLDRRQANWVSLYRSDDARDLDSRLQSSVPRAGLLEGGSTYASFFSGGAQEVNFSATHYGWSKWLKTVNPLKLAVVLLVNCYMFLRLIGFSMLELCRVFCSIKRHRFRLRHLLAELRRIPGIAGSVILLPELTVLGTSYDVARGLPIIFLNLPGYDMQAHRYGPDSKAAQAALRAIDRALRRIWKAAHRSAGREYDFWIFASHGMQATRPFAQAHRRTIEHRVRDAVNEVCGLQLSPAASLPFSLRWPRRARWLRQGRWLNWLSGWNVKLPSAEPLQTVVSGSLAHVYLPDHADCAKQKIANHLCQQQSIPMCLWCDPDHSVHLLSSQGEYQLTGDSNKRPAFQHPFATDLLDDLAQLANLPEAGDLILIAWNGGKQSTSFGSEMGTHGGPGIQETQGFALLPSDTVLPKTPRGYLRCIDLRLAALGFLGRGKPTRRLRPRPRDHRTIRVLTYNVHACVGMDGQLSVERIARVIDQTRADIVCLQELDVLRKRSQKRDQTQVIAQQLEMFHQFHPAWQLADEQFGNAVLTHLPMQVIKRDGLHHYKADRARRSALWVQINISQQHQLQLINTHLSMFPQEQRIQARELIDHWVLPASKQGPVVLCGDFNAPPTSATYRLLTHSMRDIESFDANPTRKTLFSPLPISRVDHGFVLGAIDVLKVRVIESRLAKTASDHLPVAFDIQCR